MFPSSSRNKKLHYFDWLRKHFWSTHQTWLKTYQKIKKIAIGQGDDYTTCCLLDYSYLKNIYILNAIDESNLQSLDADPKVIH